MRFKSTLSFSLHCSNTQADVPHHPDEDAIAANDNIAAVFDGVTLLHQDPYPHPSPAAEAAQKAAESALKYAQEHLGEENFIKQSFVTANSAIRLVNESHGITTQTVDFLKVQYAAAVGALAATNGKMLYYGQINDCGVMVCRPNGEVLDNLIADKSLIGPFIEKARQEHRFAPNSPEEHVFVRKHLVNNPTAEYEGQLMNDGVLTGEEIATDYIHSKEMELSKPLKVVIYSDGFIPLLERSDFCRQLFEQKTAEEAKAFVDEQRRQINYLWEASLALIDISSK